MSTPNQTSNEIMKRREVTSQALTFPVNVPHETQILATPSSIIEQPAGVEAELLKLCGGSDGKPNVINAEPITSLLNSTVNIRQNATLCKSTLKPMTEINLERLLKDGFPRGANDHLRETFSTTFTCFGLLPPGLRLRVWKEYLKFPQVVCVRHSLSKRTRPRVRRNRGPKVSYTSAAHSHTLKVNSESRQATLQVQERFDGLCKIYFNRDIDILWLSADSCSNLQNLRRCCKNYLFPRLAFDYDKWHHQFSSRILINLLMIRLQTLGVEEVYVVVKGHNACDSPNIKFVEPSSVSSAERALRKSLPSHWQCNTWESMVQSQQMDIQKAQKRIMSFRRYHIKSKSVSKPPPQIYADLRTRRQHRAANGRM